MLTKGYKEYKPLGMDLFDEFMARIGFDPRTRAQEKLEKQLHEILKRAEANEKAGERAGAACYVLLWKQADEKISAFVEHFQADRELILTPCPTLRKLETMANGTPIGVKGADNNR